MDNNIVEELITLIEKESKEHEEAAEYVKQDDELSCYADMHKTVLLRCEQLIDCLKELKEYKNLESKGLLKKFPCKEGDTVYKIIEQRDNFDDAPYKIVTAVEFKLTMLEEVGKTVFLSETDARQKCWTNSSN